MKSSNRWIFILGALLFVGGIVYTSIPRSAVSCEVCLQFDSELVCRRGAGETEEAALTAAQESACGGNARGMSEMIACRNRVPERAQCTTG